MKLIDLLVQELPKRGGWPEGVKRLEQNSEGQFFEMESDYCSEFELQKCDSWIDDTVTKAQYEAALAASKPQWGGEGLPPVGCEIEVNSPRYGWKVAVVTAITSSWIVAKYSSGVEFAGCHRSLEGNKGWTDNHSIFRPIRSEADKKRDEAVREITLSGWHEDAANSIYDLIATGKIPGVKLED